MSKSDPQVIRTTLEDQHTSEELRELLGKELGATYPREVTQSLRNDLLEAFFRKVGVDPSEVELPFEKTTYEDLRDPSIKSYYGPEHALVTALNHYLANRDIRERDAVNSLSKTVMASMIADIRARDQQPIEQEDETPIEVSDIEDFTTFMQGVNGFESDAGAYIYVLRLHRECDESEWFYVGQATGGLSGLETRIRSHIRNPTNIQRTVVRDGREILARKVECSHKVIDIERVEPLYTSEIRADRAESHEYGYLNPEKYTNFYINEAERRVAYEVAIKEDTTNVLGGK